MNRDRVSIHRRSLSVLLVPTQQPNDQEQREWNCINGPAFVQMKRPLRVDKMNEGEQRPECRQGPVKEPALLVVFDKPERDETSEHQDRTKFLNNVKGVRVTMRYIHDEGFYAFR